MALILPGRRTRQSQQSPRIDWTNPITRGLAAVFDMTGPAPVDLLTRYSGAPANFSRATCSAGIGQKKTTTTSDGTKSFLGANPNSAIVISSPLNSAAIKPFFSQRPAAGGAQYSFGANWNTGFSAAAGSLTLATNGNINLTNTAAITGSLAMYGYSLTSSTTGQLYVNGLPIATTVSGSGFPAITSPEFNILSHTGVLNFNDTTTPLMVLWNRALTDAEHQSLALNPWQLFVAPARQFYIESVGGSPDVTLALTGQAATASAGTLGVSTNKALTGQGATAAQGNVSVGSDVTVALSGQAMTGATGTLAPSTTVPLAGSAAAASAGTLVSGASVSLTGQAGTSATGTLTQSRTIALVGQSGTSQQGNVGVVGDVTVALTGQSMTMEQGLLSVASSAGGGSYGKAKKKYVVRKDGRLLVFTDEAAAVAALDPVELAQPAKQAKKAAPVPAKQAPEAKAELVVTLDDIKAEAVSKYEKAQYEHLLKARQYEALIAMYERLRAEEDEEDDFLLMTA